MHKITASVIFAVIFVTILNANAQLLSPSKYVPTNSIAPAQAGLIGKKSQRVNLLTQAISARLLKNGKGSSVMSLQNPEDLFNQPIDEIQQKLVSKSSSNQNQNDFVPINRAPTNRNFDQFQNFDQSQQIMAPRAAVRVTQAPPVITLPPQVDDIIEPILPRGRQQQQQQQQQQIQTGTSRTFSNEFDDTIIGTTRAPAQRQRTFEADTFVQTPQAPSTRANEASLFEELQNHRKTVQQLQQQMQQIQLAHNNLLQQHQQLQQQHTQFSQSNAGRLNQVDVITVAPDVITEAPEVITLPPRQNIEQAQLNQQRSQFESSNRFAQQQQQQQQQQLAQNQFGAQQQPVQRMQEFLGPKTVNQFVPPAQFDHQNRFANSNQFSGQTNQQQRFNNQAEVITLAPEVVDTELPEIISTTARSELFNGQQNQNQFGGSLQGQNQFSQQNQNQFDRVQGHFNQFGRQQQQNTQFPLFSTTTKRMQEFVGPTRTNQFNQQNQIDAQFDGNSQQFDQDNTGLNGQNNNNRQFGGQVNQQFGQNSQQFGQNGQNNQFGVNTGSGKGCMSNPCMNKGICIDLPKFEFKCQCQSGFMGDMCERPDPCASRPCGTDGICLHTEKSSPLSFTCSCKGNTFLGTSCQNSEPNPCLTAPPVIPNSKTPPVMLALRLIPNAFVQCEGTNANIRFCQNKLRFSFQKQMCDWN
jgi:hypothetical protein